MDINILLWIQEMRTDTLDVLFQRITFLAEDKFFYYVLGAMYWCISKEIGVSVGFYLNVAGILNTFVKSVLRIPRPFYRSHDLKPVASAEAGATGFSCPSGHASQAASVYGGIIFSEKVPGGIKAFMLVLTILMAFSRLYLGVHTPQDILIAFGIVLLTIAIAKRLKGWLEGGDKRDVLLAVIMVCAASGLALISFLIPYEACLEEVMYRTYMDIIKKLMMLVTFLVCWLWDRRRIHYEVSGGWKERLICFLIGAFFIFLFYNIGRDYINQVCIALFEKRKGKILGRGIGSAVLIAWVYGIYPCAILKFRKVIKHRRKYD